MDNEILFDNFSVQTEVQMNDANNIDYQSMKDDKKHENSSRYKIACDVIKICKY